MRQIQMMHSISSNLNFLVGSYQRERASSSSGTTTVRCFDAFLSEQTCLKSPRALLAGRSIRTYIQGSPAGVVKSQLLNRCLWDVYCGESPIDKTAKVLLAKTTSMLASKKKQSQLKAKL
jgi:hypothetical protein